MSANLVEQLKSKAKTLNKTIILPETEDERVLKATEIIIKEGIAKIALVGNEEEIRKNAAKIGVSVEGAVSLVEGMLFFSFSVVVVSCVVSAVVFTLFSSAKAGCVANPRKVSAMALAKSVFFTCLISYLFFNNLFLKCH